MTVSHMTFEAIEMLPKSLGCKNLKVWKCISSGIKLNKLRGPSENAVGVSRPPSVGLYFLVCTSPFSIVLDTSYKWLWTYSMGLLDEVFGNVSGRKDC